jgi:Tol biopolymer transport system component
MIGKSLGPYEITAKLGEGGMGEVYRATDSRLERQVAIKVLPAAFTEDEGRLSRFEREAKLLAQLQHSHIASIYGLEESAGHQALVMELVEGPTLDERLARGGLSLDETLRIALQIAEALEAAHEKGIIHRDLKPQNVKLTPDGTVKVLDFGLAKAMDPTAAASGADSATELAASPTLSLGQTVQGVILGTAAYMSPEQAKGAAVDKRADIWAFGVVLYEMLTGKRLFEADTASETLAGVLKSTIDLEELPSETPPALRRLLRRCLERNPRNRLRDVGDARIVLHEMLADDTGKPRTAAPSALPALRAAFLLVALPVAAILGGLIALALRPEAPVAPAVRIQRLTFSGDDQQPSASPDGRFVAFSSRRDGTSRIWLKQMEGGGEQPLTDGTDSQPRFAPDGNSVGFIRQTGPGGFDLYRTALVGGQPRRIVPGVTDFDWSPDGRSVVIVRLLEGVQTADSSSVAVVDLASGKERQLLELEGWVLAGPRWQPNDGRIVVTRAGAIGAAGGWELLLVDPSTGAVEELHANSGLGVISASVWGARGEGLYYAASEDTVGDVSGIPGELRYLVPGGQPRTLFWASGLFPFRGSGTSISVLSVLGPGRLVYDTWEQNEALREVDLEAGSVRQLTGSLATDRQPAYSPDGRFIVFSSNRTGNLDLWLLDRASGQLRQLTDDPAQDWDPGFTPDGSRILFSSGRGGDHLEIWSIALDGSDARQISRDGVDAENPTMTTDGEWIVYTSGNFEHLGLFRIRPDGTEATQITSGNQTNGEVSPNGRWALYVVGAGSDAEVRVVEIRTGRLAKSVISVPAGGQAATITFGRGRWLPGGTEVAYVGMDERGRTGVFVEAFDPDRDTSATKRKLAGFFDDVETESFGIAPDGSAIVLAVTRETRTLMLAEGLPE